MGLVPRHYSEGEGQRTAFVIGCAVWLSLSGCVLLVRAALWLRRSRPMRLAVPGPGCLARLRRAATRLVAGAQEDNVVKELQRRRLSRARTVVPYLHLGITILISATFSRSSSPDSRVASQTMDIAWLSFCYVNLLAWAFPQLLTLKTLDIWYSLLSACIAVYVSPISMRGSYAPSFDFGVYAMFIVLSLENANARLNIAWLLVITLSIWSTIVLDPGSSSRGSPFLERASHHVLMGAWLVAMILLSFHRSLSMVVRYELEAHTSKNELEAARSVLRAVCDVTVELDGAFQLQGESPQLVDMLMLNPKRLLPGEDLRSFLASEKDRQKFSEQMGQAGLPENDFVGLCAAFHVCMKDGSGIPLDVEMFGVGFANRKGEPAYFVGIREFTDTSPLLKDRAAAGLHAGRRGHAQSTPGAREEGAGREVLAQGGAESPHEADAADAAAWIDTRTAGYGVRHATPLFTRHVDTNGLFLSALDQSQRFDFISWVQQAYPALVAGSSSAREEYHERLHLRRPPLAAAGAAPPRRATTSALVQLDLTPPPSEQSCGDGLARLVLWDLRGARGAPRELAGGPAGRPPRARVLGAEREAGGPAPEVVGRERLGSQVGVGHTSVGGA